MVYKMLPNRRVIKCSQHKVKQNLPNLWDSKSTQDATICAQQVLKKHLPKYWFIAINYPIVEEAQFALELLKLV